MINVHCFGDVLSDKFIESSTYKVIILWKKVYLCDMNIDKASQQQRQSNQIMLDKSSFVRGISKFGGNPFGFPTNKRFAKCKSLRKSPAPLAASLNNDTYEQATLLSIHKSSSNRLDT